jgi:hypothetical protein
LKKLPQVGQPAVVDQGFLNKLGFKSSYDKNFLSAVKFIGLVEDKRNGAPTQLWTDLRRHFGQALAKGLREGYSDIYSFYPDAHLRDDEALRSYFRANTEGSADEVERVLNGFNAVKGLAEFGSAGTIEGLIEEDKPNDGPASEKGSVPELQIPKNPSKQVPHVNINIQLQLPPDSDGESYEKFFSAMKKHLFP